MTDGPAMPEPGAAEMRKRSVTLAGHQTSISLEAAFWDALKAIAAEHGLSVNALVERIDEGRSGNLSSAIRVFVLRHVQRGGGSRP
jgi:predicted DNA-binding ribbon-helix-helix protein